MSVIIFTRVSLLLRLPSYPPHQNIITAQLLSTEGKGNMYTDKLRKGPPGYACTQYDTEGNSKL